MCMCFSVCVCVFFMCVGLCCLELCTFFFFFGFWPGFVDYCDFVFHGWGVWLSGWKEALPIFLGLLCVSVFVWCRV